MSEDLRRRLQLYRISAESNTSNSINNEINSEAGVRHSKLGNIKTDKDIHDIMEGSFCENDNGTCFVIENRYPVSYIHGGYSLGEALNINTSSLKRICKDLREKDCVSNSVSNLLFLDTETTGLSGGTGTVAFLVGVGFFEEDAFVLRQYFMRDYDEEPALLTALNELLLKHSCLVTFNGKAFDWNLLKTRYIFNRIRLSMSDPSHIDLLFPSRRIWKLKLESCRLQSIEENILGEIRVDDIAGAQIPSIYFEYLQSRNASIIKKVIRHNELDILSMVALLLKITEMIDEPLKNSDGEQELLGIGIIFETNQEIDIVIKCFENCMDSENSSVKNIAAQRLSDIYKRSGDYSKAVSHWEKMLSSSKYMNIFPMIELAKYYEHKEKNLLKALDIVEKAIIICVKNGFLKGRYYEDLIKRKERLSRKVVKKYNA